MFVFVKTVSFLIFFFCCVEGQSTLCKLGAEALLTEARSEDSSVSIAAHGYLNLIHFHSIEYNHSSSPTMFTV